MVAQRFHGASPTSDLRFFFFSTVVSSAFVGAGGAALVGKLRLGVSLPPGSETAPLVRTVVGGSLELDASDGLEE